MSRRYVDASVCIVLAILTLLIMSSSFNWVLRNDDYYHVARAERLLNEGGIAKPFIDNQSADESSEYGWSKFAWRSDYYRPILDLSFAADYSVYGLWQAGYRLTNAVLYLLSVLLVYCLAILLRAGRPVALVAALLFLTNFGHWPAIVHQIAGRTDALVGMFVLLGVSLFIAYRIQGKILFGILALLATALALFSKETGIGVVAIFVLYDVVFTRPLDWRKGIFHLASFGIVVGYLMIRYAMFGGIGQSESLLHLPTTPGQIADILSMPMRNLVLSLEPVLPGVNESWRFATRMALLSLFLVLYVPKLVGDPNRLRFAAFTVSAFYAAAGPAVLMNPPPAGRYLFAATAFLCAWFADAVVLIWKTSKGIRFVCVKRLAAILFGLLPVAIGVIELSIYLKGGQEASMMTTRIVNDVERAVSDAEPEDKVIALAVPAICARQPIFYNGFQDWIRLRFKNTLKPYVVVVAAWEKCDDRVELEVDRVSDTQFRIGFVPNSGRNEILLSQTDLKRLKVGEYVDSSYSRVTLLHFRQNPKWGGRMPTAVEVTLSEELLRSNGRNYLFVHDGQRLRPFSYP